MWVLVFHLWYEISHYREWLLSVLFGVFFLKTLILELGRGNISYVLSPITVTTKAKHLNITCGSAFCWLCWGDGRLLRIG